MEFTTVNIILFASFVILLIFLILFIFKSIKTKNKLKSSIDDYTKIHDKYSGIIDIQEEVNKKQDELETILNTIMTNTSKSDSIKKDLDILEEGADYKAKTEEIKKDYISKKQIYDKLLSEIAIMEETLDLQEYGVYKSKYDFEDSKRFQTELENIKEQIKDMIKNKTAAVCSTNWTINGSVTEGRKDTNRMIKIALRAFNGEASAAISKVKWNNVHTMEARIEKSFEIINRFMEVKNLYISSEYKKIKLKELYLTHEYQEKKQAEKEEQRHIKELMREEERAQKEFEKAQIEAEKEENRYQKALEKARLEVETSTGKKLEKLNSQIEKLEKELKKAQEQRERAISMAQLTKSGHVYVISNIGSFGNNIYKIGMTRRLEPTDRVRELGGASVPFKFDIHAMIYSENAPELETKLHQVFKEKQVNMVNSRKEYFNVSLEEIENIVKENNSKIEFTQIAEAREYRETMAIIAEREKMLLPRKSDFPDEI